MFSPADEALDEFLSTVERARDPTYVRSHTVDEWIDNVDVSVGRRERIEAALEDSPADAVKTFELTYEGGAIESFANSKLLVRATR